MTDRKAFDAAVKQIVPEMYDHIRRDFHYPEHYNLAASNQCHVLTQALHQSLVTQGIAASRELHIDDEGLFHYLVRYGGDTHQYSDDDTIVDLNPWQFQRAQRLSPVTHTFLHGSRREVMSQLDSNGAPRYFTALRGIATIAVSHAVRLNEHTMS